MKIGIVGLGFVGKAIEQVHLAKGIPLICRDPFTGRNGSIEELLTCDAIYLSVPSPMGIDGKCDMSILDSVLDDLKQYSGVFISKVTAPPNEYTRLQQKFCNLVYAPEFLTAHNAVNDYLNSPFVIIGGHPQITAKAAPLILSSFPRTPELYECSIEEASLTKYTINSFLASKVVFMNEIYKLAQAANIDYETVSRLVKLDPRLGTSHMTVPGIDGKFGFAGACFPKDTFALDYYANNIGSELTVLRQAIETNKKLRNIE